uniref:Uncharacterized protein n=1 Tax=Prolemur simus TaxID=1328070 RepID=A0A8C9ANQ4_PROSS
NLYLVVYLSLLSVIFSPFNIAVNSGTNCSICLIFLMFHVKTTLILHFFLIVNKPIFLPRFFCVYMFY